jgi:hypothetical protein
MGIDIQLRSESGTVLAEVHDADMTLSGAATRSTFAGSRLLKYLVPWGDAIFNQAQASDLADDIRDALRSHTRTPLASRLEAISPLVDRLSRETHTYLWFVGD